jgi:GT2 family glycosyltransferase
VRLGAFVVTHRRDEHLERSLRALLGQTRVPDRILVVDNAASGATEAVVRSLDHPALTYEASPANLGSAGGTELGQRRLHEAGFELVYFGDDDNPPRTPDTIERLIGLLVGSGSDAGGAGALGARWDWSAGRLVRLPDGALEEVLEVDFIGGNHTMIMPRHAMDRVGFYNGELFFGYPDLEYCLRIRRAGYRLLVDGELMRRHRRESGRLGLTVRRSPRPRRPRSAVWRNYYTTRNYIAMMRTTFGRPDLARREAIRALGRALASWSRGPRYGAEFTRLQAKALADGYSGRLGPRVPPRAKYTRGDRSD